MSYLDGIVTPVPTGNKVDYLAIAEKAAAIFKAHGATRVVEAWGDDIPAGKVTSFPLSVKLEEGETVVFSWVLWPSKTVRDEALPKVMEAMGHEFAPEAMPFDGKRLIYGGFDVILDE